MKRNHHLTEYEKSMDGFSFERKEKICAVGMNITDNPQSSVSCNQSYVIHSVSMS